MTHRHAATLAVLAIFLFVAAPGRCGEPHTHDGFLLRMSVGPGHSETEREPWPGVDLGVDFFGPSLDYNVAVGGVVSRNLALHATLFGWTDLPARESDDSDVTIPALGGGMTAFMPGSFYLSTSLGFAWLRGDVEDADTGIMADITLGKEWWTGDDWGTGLAVGWSVHSIPAQPIDDDWRGQSLTLRLSVTRN